MTTSSHGTVDASPTKEFFVEMLTRDVRLAMAILDLIDNCIDGALRLREEPAFHGLEAKITFDDNHFNIQDNCGGIPLELAREHAFRFGRPVGAANVKHSVGRFGVGMKRALFKLGRHFDIATKTRQERYHIAVDVDRWLIQDKWEFPVSELQEFSTLLAEDETGTTIEVNKLTDETRAWLSIPYNISNLKDEIAKRHQHHIDNGLMISLNGVTIPQSQLEFLVSGSPSLLPAYQQYDRNDVHVRLLAGVGKSNPQEAGWYVYCNGRMVLDADRTTTTGWGEPNMMPKFHNQYARFRGAVFFDSDNPASLPWNTTKDGVDEGIPVFSEAYGLMVSVMRPVIRFLDAVDRDNSNPEGSRPLVDLLDDQAKPMPIKDLSPSESFRYEMPRPPTPPIEPFNTIQYRKPVWLVNAVKKSLRVETARAVGEKTFEYYVNQEDIDAS